MVNSQQDRASNPPQAKSTPLFHLAIPATNLEAAKQFYTQHLGCKVGRESEQAVILNFFGHQVVLHLDDEPTTTAPQKGIYPRHFGLVFAQSAEWEAFLHRLNRRNTSFHIAPKLRFPNRITEHWSCFLADPSQNLLEFKHYIHPEAIFGARERAEVGDAR